MKQKIKFKLWRTNSTVHFQILEQEGIDKRLSKHIVVSYQHEFFYEKIGLRKEDSVHNDKIINFIFNSEQEALNYIERVISWFDEVFHQPEPKRGDIVLVRDKAFCQKEFEKRIFLAKIEGASYPYVCVRKTEEDKFKCNEEFNIFCWKEMKTLNSNWNPETGVYEAEREE